MTRFPPPPPGAERRAHPRYPVVVAVEIAHDDAITVASLVDLSHGGAFLELADPDAVSPGVRVRVHLAVDGHDVDAEGKVVRVTTGANAGCAVAWTAPSPAVAAVVDHVVEQTARLADRLAGRLTDRIIDHGTKDGADHGRGCGTGGRVGHSSARHRRLVRHHPGAGS